MLVDDQHPDEPLEAEVEQLSELVLGLAVPNTLARFELHRLNAEMPFEGELGGRHYKFDPKRDSIEEGGAHVRAIEYCIRFDLL